MNKTKLLSTLFSGLFCIAIFTQCGETKKEVENHADKGKEMMDDAANKGKEMMDDAAKAGEKMADETADKAKEGMDAMDSKAGDLSFEAGSWANGVLQGLNSGNSTVFTLDQVPFEGDNLSDAGNEQLDNLAAILKANPDWTVEVQGHTEGPGKKLGGLARAKWVQGKLNLRGITGKQISGKGYGAEKLIPGLEETDEKHRRVTVEITK